MSLPNPRMSMGTALTQERDVKNMSPDHFNDFKFDDFDICPVQKERLLQRLTMDEEKVEDFNNLLTMAEEESEESLVPSNIHLGSGSHVVEGIHQHKKARHTNSFGQPGLSGNQHRGVRLEFQTTWYQLEMLVISVETMAQQPM